MIGSNFFRLGLLALTLAGVLGCAGTGHQAAVTGPGEYSSGTHGYFEERPAYYYPNGPLGPDAFGWNYEYYKGHNNPFQYRDLPSSGTR